MKTLLALLLCGLAQVALGATPQQEYREVYQAWFTECAKQYPAGNIAMPGELNEDMILCKLGEKTPTPGSMTPEELHKDLQRMKKALQGYKKK